MHGVKRLSQEKRLAKRKENEERAAAYRGRSKAAFERREKKQFDQESLDAIQKVVLENPDHATMWNFRREVLQAMHPPSAGDTEERKAACKAEFQLTQEGLQINPKSYPVWYHRQWVLEWGKCSWQWPVELKLTAKLLALDDRIFHCWTYRRFVVKTAGVTAAAELGFTIGKIEANFTKAPQMELVRQPATFAPDSPPGSGPASAARFRLCPPGRPPPSPSHVSPRTCTVAAQRLVPETSRTRPPHRPPSATSDCSYPYPYWR